MEVERGVYRALLRLGFEMYISPILALAIIQVLAITKKYIQPIKLFSSP